MGQIVTDNTEIFGRLGISSPTATQSALALSAIRGAEGSIREYLRYDPVQRTRTEYYTRSDFYRNWTDGVWDIQSNQAIFVRDSIGNDNELQLKHLPIRSITSLWFNSDGRNGTRSFSSEHLKTEGTDFWANYDIEDASGNKVCHDGILRSFGLWGASAGSVKITYVAGYTAAELIGGGIIDASPIYEAILNEATRRTKSALLEGQTVGGGTGTGSGGTFTAGSVQSERLGDYSYTMGSSIGARGSTSDRLYGGIYSCLPSTREMLSGFVNYAIAD